MEALRQEYLEEQSLKVSAELLGVAEKDLLCLLKGTWTGWWPNSRE
jgi:hypothetical protein